MGERTVKRNAILGLAALAIASATFADARAETAAGGDQEGWAGTWGAAPVFPVGPVINGQTVRQFVRVSVGGSRVRVRLSNETGTDPLVIGAAHLAVGAAQGAIDPATDHALTFGGRPSVTIPPGAPAVSDPVDLDVRALATLAVSVYVPRWTGPTVVHPDAVQTAYVSKLGVDATGETTIPEATTAVTRFFLTGVEVSSPGQRPRAIVTLGDSITDGNRSTLDANRRWPDRLAERLAEQGRAIGVVNEGLSGNRVLHDLPEATFGPSALARFDRDVLGTPGAAYLVVMESINDIGHPTQAGLPEQAVSAEDIITGLRQIATRAHAHGIKVFGATLTPYEGTIFPRYFTPEGEAKRQAVNEWIRTSGVYDGVIDFDAAIRDPGHPARVLSAYDSGDHLHPNDAGYKAMADSIDLDLFR
jgi:lysophospholipase L1-like esterase